MKKKVIQARYFFRNGATKSPLRREPEAGKMLGEKPDWGRKNKLLGKEKKGTEGG